MRIPIQLSKIIGIAACAISLIALVFHVQYDVFNGFGKLREKALLQQQGGDNIKSLSNLLAAIVDMESGARGYLLSGDVEFLEPFILGERNYARATEAVAQRLTNELQVQRLARSRILEAQWREEYLSPLIEQRRRAKSEPDVLAIWSASSSVSGKKMVDELRRTLRSMIDEETLLSQRHAQELVVLQEEVADQLLRLAMFILLTVLLLVTLVLHAFRASEARAKDLVAEVRTRRLAEQQALDGELRIEALLDSLAEGVAITDHNARIVYSNGQLSHTWGYGDSILNGTNLLDLASDAQRPGLTRLLEAARAQDQKRRRISILSEGRRADGNVFPIEVALSRYATDRGVFFAAVIRDITERKRAEAVLREALSLQQAIFDSADYAIIATDSMGRVRTLNRTAERLIGEAEKIQGKWLSGFFSNEWVAKREAKLRADGVCPAIDGPDFLTYPAALGETDEDEAELVSADGERHPVFTSITVLKDERGQPIGYLVVAKDLTERLAVERMKSEFVAMVSHELRTPLAAILGSLGLLHEGDVGEVPKPLEEFVEIAYENSVRLSHLIDDILDLSKIESGRVTHHPIEFLVDRFLHEVVTLNTGYAQKFDVSIQLVEPVPDATLFVDRNRLMQIMTNLVSNAVKFSPKGGTVNILAKVSSGSIRISVVDSGPGVPESFWPKIFGKFAQADGSDTRQQGGTGLGLAISKALVEAMGGRIGFVQKPAPGAEFYVELPLSYQARSPGASGRYKKV